MRVARTLRAAERRDAWRAGIATTLDRFKGIADDVILIGDVPRSDVDVPVCLSSQPDRHARLRDPVPDAPSA